MSLPNDRPLTEQLEQAKRFLLDHDRFLVVSHVQPDGDAASSTCAVGLILQALNKSFRMVNEGPLPGKFGFLQGSREVGDFSSGSFDYAFESVIAVDCADDLRMGELRERIAADTPVLNIDHHPTNNFFGSVHLIRPEAAATAEILFELAEYLEAEWTEPLATCIYTGLLTDTGGFRYANTSPKVMEIASKLLSYGVNGNFLAETLLESLTMEHVLLLKRALNTLSFSNDNRIGWLSVSAQDLEEIKATNDDMEGFVNYPRNIHGVEVGLLFKEMARGKVKVSMRSGGNVDVSRIAQEFGGGGHVRASGCTVAGSLDEAVRQVVERIGRELA